MPRFRPAVIRFIILAVALGGATVACDPAADALPTAQAGAGASGQPGADASGGAAPSGPLPSGAIADPAEAWPAFAACLRAHGANVADPEVDAEGNPQWHDEIKQFITEPIRAACSPILAAVDEGGTLKGGGRSRRTYSAESELAHAECMRSHGVPDFPDPDPNGEPGSMPQGFDKSDPTVYAALVACESTLVETASPSPAL